MATNPPSKPCDGRSEKVCVPHEKSRSMDITRTWNPKGGSQGYFAHDRYRLLPLVCLATGTKSRIEKIGDETRIQLQGSAEWEVNAAMQKLDGLASVMNLTDVAYLATMVLASQTESLGYCVEHYAAVDCLASFPRVLLDAVAPLGEVLGMQVPVAYHCNAETRKWELVEKLRNTPCLVAAVTDDPETTRAWADFRFPATGSSNAFSGVPSAIHSGQGVNVEAGSKEHPHLRSSKADELTKWVQIAKLSSGGERTGHSSSALLSMDGSVSNSKSSTKEATVPRRPRGRKTPMTRAAYGARQTYALGARPSRPAPASRPSSSALNRPETHLIHTLPVKPPAKFLAEAKTTKSLPHQANIPGRPCDGAVDKPAFMAIPASKSSLRATAAEFISMRGRKQFRFSLYASSSLRPTAPVFIPAAQRENQPEPLLTSPTLHKPDLLTMPLMDLPIVEEKEDNPVKIAGTACVKMISPAPSYGVLIDFGSPTHSPADIQQEAIEDECLLIDASWPVETINVDEGLLDPSSLGGPTDKELILHERNILDIQSLLPALAAEERTFRLPYTPDNCPRLMDLPCTFDRLRPEGPNINLSPAQGAATHEFLFGLGIDAASKCEVKLGVPDYAVEPKPSVTEEKSQPALGILKHSQPALDLLNYLSQGKEEGKGKEREAELVEAPVLHLTMNQKAAPNFVKKTITEPEAVMETGSNAVIIKASEEVPKRRHSPAESCVPSSFSQSQAISKTSHMKQKLPDAQIEQAKYLFNTIEPLLDAAAWYPGPLSLDISFGLLLFHSSPNPAKKKFMSLDYLKTHLKNGLASSSCRFFDRLTTLPSDVDHIINLQVNNCRLFDERPAERNFQYEFQCKLGGEQFLVVMDQSQKISIPQTPVHIGSVHLNVPGSIWDASLAIHGTVRHFTASSKKAKEAAEEIGRNIFVEPDRAHIRLVLKTPKDLRITKIILQRTTTYRHIRPKGVDSRDNDQYMYLRVKETQNLIVLANYSDNVVTAHCATRKEMVKAHRQWWSVSLISPILDAILQGNSTVETGDKTTAWKPKCLFGDDAKHLWHPESSESLPELPFASVGPEKFNETTLSSSIGCAGLGSLVRLAESVVKNINSVGANNAGLGMKIDKRINRDDDKTDAKGLLTSRKIVVNHRGLVTGKKAVFW